MVGWVGWFRTIEIYLSMSRDLRIERIPVGIRGFIFLVSRRFASRIHEISDLKKSSRAQS